MSKRKFTRARIVTNLQSSGSAGRTGVQHVAPYDENLLERARTQWQFGDWESLVKLDESIISNNPDRAHLALLAAAGRMQIGNIEEAGSYINVAQKWGASKESVVKMLASGVHNCLGRSFGLSNNKSKAEKHFEGSIETFSPSSDVHLLANARSREQFAQLAYRLEGYQNDSLREGRLSLEDDFKGGQNNSNKSFKQYALGLLGSLFFYFSSDDISSIELFYQDKCLVSLGQNLTKLGESVLEVEEIFETNSVEQLVECVKIVVTGQRGCVTYKPERWKPVKPSDKVLHDLCDSLSDSDRSKYTGYIKGNYARISEDANVIEKMFPQKDTRILDVGSVPPLLSEILIAKGYENLTVIDPSVKKFERYLNKNGVSSIEASVFDSEIGFIDNPYDLVTFCEVIEHLTGDLRTVIKLVSRFVKTGGSLLLTTPNLRSIPGCLGLFGFQSGLASKYKETIKAQYDRFDRDGFYGHLREFTVKEIIDLLSSYGFRHQKSFYQPDYRTASHPISKLSSVFEATFPELRLFGRHLFTKVSDS